MPAVLPVQGGLPRRHLAPSLRACTACSPRALGRAPRGRPHHRRRRSAAGEYEAGAVALPVGRDQLKVNCDELRRRHLGVADRAALPFATIVFLSVHEVPHDAGCAEAVPAPCDLGHHHVLIQADRALGPLLAVEVHPQNALPVQHRVRVERGLHDVGRHILHEQPERALHETPFGERLHVMLPRASRRRGEPSLRRPLVRRWPLEVQQEVRTKLLLADILPSFGAGTVMVTALRPL
mmetsp:Transcript_709/g.2257  ORF Transcript_709/g.2257 Transcript_709/m.2257 type:complete len:237 (+) Transcript_709:422-1132(+)